MGRLHTGLRELEGSDTPFKALDKVFRKHNVCLKLIYLKQWNNLRHPPSLPASSVGVSEAKFGWYCLSRNKHFPPYHEQRSFLRVKVVENLSKTSSSFRKRRYRSKHTITDFANEKTEHQPEDITFNYKMMLCTWEFPYIWEQKQS